MSAHVVVSLAALRSMGEDETITKAALEILLDIAEAALELPQRVTSYKLDEALAEVRK